MFDLLGAVNHLAVVIAAISYPHRNGQDIAEADMIAACLRGAGMIGAVPWHIGPPVASCLAAVCNDRLLFYAGCC